MSDITPLEQAALDGTLGATSADAPAWCPRRGEWACNTVPLLVADVVPIGPRRDPIADRIADLERRIASLAAIVAQLAQRLDALEARLDRGQP